MKHLILLTGMIVPTNVLFTMEVTNTKKLPQEISHKIRMRDRDLDTSSRPFITIINGLPIEDTFLSNQPIGISDKVRVNSYINQPYTADFFTTTICAGEGVRFSPYKDSTLPEHERLGLNNNENAALIQLHVPAAIKHQLMQLYIGEYSKIKFGDTIRFGLESDGAIIMKHNGKKLKEIETQRPIEIVGAPHDKETRNLEPLLMRVSNSK